MQKGVSGVVQEWKVEKSWGNCQVWAEKEEDVDQEWVGCTWRRASGVAGLCTSLAFWQQGTL